MIESREPRPSAAPRPRRIELPSRGGSIAALEFGPAGQTIDGVFSHPNGFNALTCRTILAASAQTLRILGSIHGWTVY